MPPSFVCAQCGRAHEGLVTDQGWTLPDDVWAIPEPERATRANWNSDLCKLGERYFIRCLLSIPFTERGGYFGWGVWVEVDRSDFARYVDVYDKDAYDEPPARGTLANLIPCYEDAARERVILRFGSSSARPNVLTAPGSTSSLARDQARGINDARYHEILHAVGAI